MSDEWLRPTWPVPANIHALVTTRAGGASGSPFDAFNLAAHVGDAPDAVAANRARLGRALPADPVWLEQVHGTTVVDPAAAGPLRADGAVTRSRGVVCAVLTADCLPVFLADREGTAVGVAHAGWRGLAAGVIEAAVARFDLPGDRLVAYLGPAISQAHYEVGRDVFNAFVEADAGAERAFAPRANDKYLCDLFALARMRLVRVGVRDIFGGDACTFRDRSRFYSFRRDGVTGRMASLIWIP